MPVMATWSLQAFNTATHSDNKIHDDEVASRFGFTGGLVPGVDVYAYLTHLPAEAWGEAWLARGRMRGRFLTPVYDGETVTVAATSHVEDDDGVHVDLEVRNAAGDVCAVGTATLPDEEVAQPSAALWPDVAQAKDRPPASPLSLAVGTAFGLAPHGFHAAKAGEYLDAVRETLPLYASFAHPGWLLRHANYVLASNVVLGPWIHVESATQHFSVVRDGQVVSARALVTREWEHKGHRFVSLDVALLADGAVAARVQHTAIYAPRQVTS